MTQSKPYSLSTKILTIGVLWSKAGSVQSKTKDVPSQRLPCRFSTEFLEGKQGRKSIFSAARFTLPKVSHSQEDKGSQGSSKPWQIHWKIPVLLCVAHNMKESNDFWLWSKKGGELVSYPNTGILDEGSIFNCNLFLYNFPSSPSRHPNIHYSSEPEISSCVFLFYFSGWL